MQQSRYRIRFINGDLKGRSFAVKDSGLVIGSSMDSDIRSSDSGIVAEHATLLPQTGSGILLHNSGDGDVWVRNMALGNGEDKMLEPGDDVRLGKNLSFIVERHYQTPPKGDMPNVPPDTGAATILPQDYAGQSEVQPENVSNTRYASAEELSDLRNANKSMARQRKLSLFFGVLISAAILALAFYISESRIENPVTWPGEKSGNYDDGEYRIDLGNNGKFLIYYPNSPSMVKESGDGSFEVLTAAGENLDVPFHIVFKSEAVKNGYGKTTRKSFNEWTERMEKSGMMRFSSPSQQDFFNKGDNGYPYIKIDYSRKLGNMSWRGVACYMRFLDKEIVLLREVPTAQYWRSEGLVRDYDCISVANSTVLRHWEIPEKPINENATKMLKMLNRELNKNLEVASWEDIDLLLRNLFREAYVKDEKPLIETATSLLEKFRAKQKIWYSRKCLEYSDARNRANNAEMTRILNECLERFEPLNDYRYIRIMKNDWSVE